MVRKILFGIIIFLAFMVNAQDFSLDTSGVNVVGDTLRIEVEDGLFGREGEIDITFTNISSSSKTIIFKRHNLSQEHLNFSELCDDKGCMFANPVTVDISIDSKTFAAGETLTYMIHDRFSTSEAVTNANSHELYTAYEVGNESNAVSVDIIFSFESTSVSQIANNLTFSKAYPNPVNENINFNYNLKYNSNGFVTIHDVTGKQIVSLELVQGIEKVTYNTTALNNGIYFYNVYVDGVKTTTNKFIVRH